MIKSNVARTPMQWASAAADSIMATYKPGELPPAHRWHYHQGVFLCGVEQIAEQLGEARYDDYIQGYIDDLVDEQGNLFFARDELDSIQAGLLLFRQAERTGKPQYKVAADKLRNLFRTLNRTTEGGYWHKDKYPHQMWLDGLYMGGVFALKYADIYGDDELREEVLQQERLMRKYMKDERTGLLYHAWDESRQMPWADPDTGCSPEFWGRSLGWYGLALTEFIALLPEEHPSHAELKEELGAFVEAIIRYQDEETGLWYQVVDKGSHPDNWLETSCSSLFVYTIARAVQQSAADETCMSAARKGFAGLAQMMETDDLGHLVMPSICIGTSAGDYENYVTRPVSKNDLHGVGAFIMAAVAMQDKMTK
ncbi:glycoside hydrolase family 88/105 protein [Paenibacillus gallinarum]|uniref:Glycoside hydrolase family 88 protein n=1 Tax=Paenibacillus gallinarum TaxID=2762232 RepID=A0ABR8SYN4_9BACL|nr:glycoside hydrolase family 88 protein [Paenibacillus gallinarum]MBD7968605.1 glycoside hydrolase family 88 protein [Paenibacillus gallinarum]